MTMTVDHIGIAVNSIEAALPFYRDKLGLRAVHSEEVASQNVRAAFLQAGESCLELLEPIGSEGAVAKFLKHRGPGLHHVAFQVEDIKKEMNRLTPLEALPRAGARGHQVCFLHPNNAHGVLIELVQHD
ncbi:MAG: methylmalonyl-CoA epimerase [Elusimicrobia bacterium RIFCSPHIGHO2_02_FULL_57_9]|nr:MAG: methylmalonyl-CoA epimerase [Elusimicrobia bacterium RIFCSPHIGHO2_02_FULL_57_9]